MKITLEWVMFTAFMSLIILMIWTVFVDSKERSEFIEEIIEFCQDEGGEYEDKYQCLRDENGTIESYTIINFKGDYRLLK